MSELLEWIYNAETEYADSLAISTGDKEFLFRDIKLSSDKVAEYLSNYSKRVFGILCRDKVRAICSALGILKSGNVFVFLDSSDLDRPFVRFLDIEGIITDDVIHHSCFNFMRYEHIQKMSVGQYVLKEISNSCPAYVVCTSGTTSTAKAVLLPHEGIFLHVKAFVEELALSKRDKVGQFANFSFDAAISEIFTSYLTGATLFIIPEEEKGFLNFERYVFEKQITFITLPPSYASMLSERCLSSFRVLITAGASVNPNIAQKCNSIFVNAYGPCEMSICSTMYIHKGHWENGECEHIVPIGTPLSHINCYIKNGEKWVKVPSAEKVEGELVIVGRGMLLGYLGNPALFHSKLIDVNGEKGYSTGDIVRSVEGELYFLYRQDSFEKIRGMLIDCSGPVEVTNTIDSVKDSYCFVYKDDKREILALAVVSNNRDIKLQIINKLLQHYKFSFIPFIFFVESLPLNRNGKVEKSVLALECQKCLQDNFCDGFTNEFYDIIKNKLEMDFDPNYTFYELGVDSISIISVMQAIYEKYRVKFTLSEFLNFNIYSLEGEIKNRKEATCGATVSDSSSLNRLIPFYLCNEKHKDSLWYNQQIAWKIPVVTDQMYFKINVALKNSLREIPVFFTSYTWENDKLKVSQEVSDDFSLIKSKSNEAFSYSLIKRHCLKWFDLSHPPLIHGYLLQCADGTYLVLDMPHIVVDWEILGKLVNKINYFLAVR